MWNLSEYRYAASPGEAVALLRQGPGRGCYIAGGTDLLLQPPEVDFVVDVNGAGLDGLALTPGGDLFLGAALPLQRMVESPLVADFAGGVVARVASRCGNRPVRTTATLGGNLCNGLPSADMAPALLVLDAVAHISDEEEQESIPLSGFFLGPRRTVLDDRLLVGVSLPADASGRCAAARKLSRTAEDIALVQVAVGLEIDGGTIAEARVALGAVAPVPLRAEEVEVALVGLDLTAAGAGEKIRHAAGIAAEIAEPIDDLRASAEYRRAMVGVLCERLLKELANEAGAGEGGGA